MNLPTQFRRITILQFVLAGLVLLFSVAGLFADGIASRYPNDVGIQNDPNVIKFEDFEKYTSSDQLKPTWTYAGPVANLRIATETGHFVLGHKGLEMKLPLSSSEMLNRLQQALSTQEQVVFIRAYMKWDSGYDNNAGHDGFVIHAHYPGGFCQPAPPDGTGFATMDLDFDMFSGLPGEHPPGYGHFYVYWPHQRVGCGDHWYPNGWVIPGDWGDWIKYPSQYPDFVPYPNWQPELNRWYCIEAMLKLNTVGLHDGVSAFWVDGQLRGSFPDLYLRSIDTIEIDLIGLVQHMNVNSVRVNTKWYDNVVIARSYIGPISAPQPISRAVADFNGDGHPDYVLYKSSTRQTAVWYMNNAAFVSGAYGRTLPAGWSLAGVADFNGDGNPDYLLFNHSTRQSAIWYLSGVTFLGGAYGETLPSGWTLVATGDFNGDSKPDYVLYNASTGQTAVWYMNNNIFVRGAFGRTLPAGWSLAGVADFNGDGKQDYLLFNAGTRQSAIWYLSGVTFISGAYGPTIASGYKLIGVADFNGNGKPDYLLYNASTGQTAIWYMNNAAFVSGAYGPTLPAGWSLVAP
jgi:hypothetical protein